MDLSVCEVVDCHVKHGSEKDPVEGPREQGNELSGSIHSGQFLD